MSNKNAIRTRVHEIIRDNPDWLPLCHQFHSEASSYILDEGQPSQISYQQLFLQEHMATESITAGYLIAYFHRLIMNGTAALVAIKVPDSPRPNSSVAENNAVLEGINAPFQAEFHGNPGDEDGTLWWDANHHRAPEHQAFEGKTSFPLEVGTCAITSLWVRTVQRGGWARWCYGSNFVYLFAAPKKALTLDSD